MRWETIGKFGMLLYEPICIFKESLAAVWRGGSKEIKVNKSKETNGAALTIIQTRDVSGSE